MIKIQRQIEKDTMDDYEPNEQYYEQYDINNEISNSQKKNPGPRGRIRNSAASLLLSDVMVISLLMFHYAPVRRLQYE